MNNHINIEWKKIADGKWIADMISAGFSDTLVQLKNNLYAEGYFLGTEQNPIVSAYLKNSVHNYLVSIRYVENSSCVQITKVDSLDEALRINHDNVVAEISARYQYGNWMSDERRQEVIDSEPSQKEKS